MVREVFLTRKHWMHKIQIGLSGSVDISLRNLKSVELSVEAIKDAAWLLERRESDYG